MVSDPMLELVLTLIKSFDRPLDPIGFFPLCWPMLARSFDLG